MHTADGEVCLPHLLSQPIDLSLGVAEDDSLRDCQSRERGRVKLQVSKTAAGYGQMKNRRISSFLRRAFPGQDTADERYISNGRQHTHVS